MNSRTREGFYMLWTIAILVCLAVCVFLLIWASFARGGDAAQAPPAGDVPAQTEGQAEGQTEGQTQDGQQPVLPGGENAALVGGETSGAENGDAASADGGTTPAEGGVTQVDAASAAAILGETPDAGQAYLDRLVFLGDSTTYGLYANELLPHQQVWTPVSGTLTLYNYAVETIDYFYPDGTEAAENLSIADCAATGQPEYLVITLGLNGVASLDEQAFKQYYTGLVQTIQQASPNTRIICNSIYPVIDGVAPSDITNAKINAANGWILDVAVQTGTRYLATHDALTDETGNLSGAYINAAGDGIHMDANGYGAILQYVRTHAWQ